MCPLWPIHYLLVYVAAIVPVWLLSFRVVGAAADVATKNSGWNVQYDPKEPGPIMVDNYTTFTMNLMEWPNNQTVWIDYIVTDAKVAAVSPERVEVISEAKSVEFNVTGKFLGYSKVCPNVTYSEAGRNVTEQLPCLDVSVSRKQRVIDKAFTYSVIVLVSIIYINMGAALDLRVLKETLRRPVGPAIGFFTQFGIMPVLSYAIGKLLLTLPALQLGLFITGCSPGGGASNIWTLTMGGNLDLSITMTTVSTFSAFAMMPLWMLTLGSTLFHDANLKVPYRQIVNFAICLVIPLGIGLLIQRFLPKFAAILVKILKPFAIFLIAFIVFFAVYTNLYLFSLFTWEIIVAGLLLPWLGYLFGGGTSYLMKQDWRDVIAIAVETGVQNTGLAIFALRFSLPQPEADLTTVIPVAVACATPIIPTLVVLFQKIRGYKIADDEDRKSSLFPQSTEENRQGLMARF